MITDAAVNFIKERYFKNGEDWSQLCTRVSSFLGNNEQEKQEYYDMIVNCRALPNSPTLMNAGTVNGYLSACNLLPIPDSLEGIMEAAKSSALTQKHGGGVGFNFSKLRPTGDKIGSTGGTSSGVVSFLQLFDIVGQIIKQGGKRRSANLGLLRYDHPDILRWIAAKNENGILSTFNLSIAVTDEFFAKVNNDEIMGFVNPRTGKHFPAYDPVLESDRTIIRARELFNRIVKSMWDYGEPGLVFWDTLQRGNPTPHLGEINGVNPCGESPLRYGESCCRGSVNLFEHMNGKTIEMDKIQNTVRIMVRMLNAVIDKNVYPLPLIEEETKRTRKIGVGVMGFADVLGRIGIRYGSQKSIDLVHTIMSIIKETARSESELLASKYGTYPAWNSDTRIEMRNATVLSIAPTGSISIISGVSSGAEPFFKIFYQLNREDKEPITVFARSFMEALKDVGKEHLIADMMAHDYSPLQMIERGYLDDSFNHFVTTNEVTPNEHVMIQAAFQSYVDMAISKTINMDENGTIDEIVDALHLAHATNCKGITIYRDNCKRGSFLSEISCESCGSKELAHSEGCVKCKKCGVSLCAVS